ncbi:hypothetical protein ACHAWF_009887 [Thalassiosira exigua]
MNASANAALVLLLLRTCLAPSPSCARCSTQASQPSHRQIVPTVEVVAASAVNGLTTDMIPSTGRLNPVCYRNEGLYDALDDLWDALSGLLVWVRDSGALLDVSL